ncbi:MAG: tyrosine-type recombinase/integrase [Gaiellaceae bacterium]
MEYRVDREALAEFIGRQVELVEALSIPKLLADVVELRLRHESLSREEVHALWLGAGLATHVGLAIFEGTFGERVPLKTLASASSVPLLPALAVELLSQRQRVASVDLSRVHRDAYVFTTATGKPQSVRNALRAVHVAGDRAGLNEDRRERVGLHDLRHSFVAIALASGLTSPEASALARHANSKITAAAYAGLTDAGRGQLASKLAKAFEA